MKGAGHEGMGAAGVPAWMPHQPLSSLTLFFTLWRCAPLPDFGPRWRKPGSPFPGSARWLNRAS